MVGVVGRIDIESGYVWASIGEKCWNTFGSVLAKEDDQQSEDQKCNTEIDGRNAHYHDQPLAFCK